MLKSCLNKGLIEAGCDEAGRGCLAGPVTAAAVILPATFSHPALNDSKKLNKNLREELRVIIEKEAIAFAVAMVDNNKIDQINILNASILAMHKALDRLNQTPDHILVDGNRFKPYKQIPYTTIIKGDGKFSAIAAASVLAKTYRDEYMEKLHLEFPAYGWSANKAYPTAKHRDAIMRFGTTEYHRKSFTLIPPQLKLGL